MHDRRVDGEALVFGNQGALLLANMTWWDHKTGSIWTQLTGEAIAGPLEGTKLQLIPMSIAPWNTWFEQHPDTVELSGPDDYFFLDREELPRDRFVIGIALGNDAKGYPYEIASQERVINDTIGDTPILVYVDPATRSIHTYLRQVDDRALTFEMRDGSLIDLDTGSVWEPSRGVALDGDLKGDVLFEIPYVTSFDWAWMNFYPDTDFYSGG